MIFSKAVYTSVNLTEYQGNPIIEALPKKLKDVEVINELGFYPECLETEKEIPSFERVEYLSRIENLVQPLPEYLICFRMIETLIKEGYSAKNPFSPTTNFHLNYLSHSQPKNGPHTGKFSSKAKAMTVMGISGVGKSRMIQRCLDHFPQVIEHESYKGNKLLLRQTVWLYVECSHDSTLRGLCHTILSKLDDALGLEGVERSKPASTIAPLLDQIEQRVKSSFLGLLVIDEMQALSIAKAGGAENLLSFLLNLINRCGVPILFCGNPEIEKVLQTTFRIARRAESGGVIKMHALKCDELWNLFVDELWKLQWTNIETPLTPNLEIKLHELSTGILDVASRIYSRAQKLVIGSKDERITIEVLERAHSTTCELTEPSLVLLRRKQNSQENRSSSSKFDYSHQIKQQNEESKIIITGDLDRAHHQEFFEQLTDLNLAVDLRERMADPDLYQQAYYEEDSLDFLKEKGLICEDPLGYLS
jgi:hypothetical protein